MEHPKFVINNGNIIFGHVEFHSDLLRDHKETVGGGWWYLDRENKIMYLYGKSQDYGAVTEEQAKEAWKNSHYSDQMQMIFSTEEKLINVLQPEGKNKAVIYVDGKKIGECSDVTLPDLDPAVIGADFGSESSHTFLIGGRSYGKLQRWHEQLKKQGVKVISMEDDMPAVQAKIVDSYNQIKVPIHAVPEIPVYGPEKKKKKPCTYHEYVLKGTDSQDYEGGSIVREIWRCRHCDHPLN